MAAVPFIMFIIDYKVLQMRTAEQARLFAEYETADNAWKASVIEMVDAREVITTYRQGFNMEKDFAGLNKTSNQRRFEAAKYQNVTMKVLKWIHTVFFVLIFLVCGFMTTEDVMEVADFVVIIGTILKFDSEITNLFKVLFGTITGVVSIKKIADLLNSATRRKALLAGKKRRLEIMKRVEIEQPDFDFDPTTIVVYQVEYDYNMQKTSDFDKKENSTDGDSEDDALAQQRRVGPISLIIEQGMICCIQSSGSSGKKTILKLLARFILPTSGIIWYPENLRVRYISDVPVLFSSTVMKNLRFGPGSDRHSDEEIWSLCRKLGLSEPIIGRGDVFIGTRGAKLSLSDRCVIVIARALLSSVDLLLMSNTFDVLGLRQTRGIIRIFREWMKHRGVPDLSSDMPPGVPTALKKKKTLFFVSKNEELEKDADCVINLMFDVGPKPAPKSGRSALRDAAKRAVQGQYQAKMAKLKATEMEETLIELKKEEEAGSPLLTEEKA
jgi:ABC-type multidrug transport system fused ATPase/permease subunit